MRLVDCTTLPHTVAEAVGAELANNNEDVAGYISDAVEFGSDKAIDFALVLSAIARNKGSDHWVDRFSGLVAELSLNAELTAKLLLGWPDETQTWEFAATFGADVQQEYWLRKRPFAFRNGIDEALQGVENYLQVGRASAALTALHRLNDQVPSQTLLKLLDAILAENFADEHALDRMLAYNIELVLKTLDKRSDISSEEIAAREYAYLPLLRERGRPLAIHRFMASDPSFYMSLLASVFHGDNEANGDVGAGQDNSDGEMETKASKAQQAQWRSDYRLLTEFRILPGASSGGIDARVLREWVYRLRQMAAEQHRKAIADQYIGHVLVHAPPPMTMEVGLMKQLRR